MNIFDNQAELLQALAHPVRLEILEVLRDGEQCVCHLESVLGLRQAYMSQQLMALRKVGLVAHRKDGLRMYYRVLDPGVYAILDVARSLVSRRAAKLGGSSSLARLGRAKPHSCTCPKCAQPSLAKAA